MTFNIWNYQHDWRRRRDIIARLIDAHRPDVVALQETRHDPRYEGGRGQGEQLAELVGYHLTTVVAHVFVPFLGVNEGLSILTSSPPLRVMQCRLTRASLVRRVLDRTARADGNQRVCLGVAVRAGAHEAHIYDTHFSLSGQGRLLNAIEVTRFIREESGETPAVLMGDLNADPPDLPLRYLRGELTVEGQTGDFVDCWTAVHPDDAGLTDETWDPRRRIDYVLGRNLPAPPTGARLVGCDPIDGIYPSDHRGIVVDLPF